MSDEDPFTSSAVDQNENPKETEVTANNTEETSQAENPEYLIKHPLQNKWALWYFKNDRSKSWNENLKVVAKFEYVEDFWALYNHIQPASKLQIGCDYSIFKDGIQPAWEDERNRKGGRWLITLNKNQRTAELDRFWMETLLCLIGEAFEEHSDNICGATVNIRAKADKLAVWTADAVDRDSTMAIGKRLKERLGVPSKVQIGYEVHDDTMTRKGSVAQNKYTV